jgi:protocatechuate 3,4-dioxygenase beta subunit
MTRRRFLRAVPRGRQRSDEAGRCRFRTIYPGWYGGRTVHMHLIADVDRHRWISQLFFPDALNDEVLTRRPNGQRPGGDTTNATDDIFAHRGEDTLLTVVRRRWLPADIYLRLSR